MGRKHPYGNRSTRLSRWINFDLLPPFSFIEKWRAQLSKIEGRRRIEPGRETTTLERKLARAVTKYDSRRESR